MGGSKVKEKMGGSKWTKEIIGGSETIDNGGSKWTKEIMGGSE